MKKTNIFVVITIGIIIIIGVWTIFPDGINQSVPEEEIEVSQESFEEKVLLIINNGEGSAETLETEFREGITAFDLLKSKTEELDIVLRTKTYDMGIFIEAIGDKENGQEEKYWLYYVNGEMPMIAADKKEIKPGDKIEFRFEKSPF